MKIGYLRNVEFVVSCMAFSGGMGKIGQYLASISKSQALVAAFGRAVQQRKQTLQEVPTRER